MVVAERAIQFECENCGHMQYDNYALSPGWYINRAVNEDNIVCAECGHDNHVIEEL